MSQDDSDDDGAVERALRTVTPPSAMHRNSEMNVIGWVIFLLLLVVAVPLIPILVAIWVILKVYRIAQPTEREDY